MNIRKLIFTVFLLHQNIKFLSLYNELNKIYSLQKESTKKVTVYNNASCIYNVYLGTYFGQ